MLKKLFLVMFSLFVNRAAAAGNMKEIFIVTQDAVFQEFFENAHLEVVNLHSGRVLKDDAGLYVIWFVDAKHPESGLESQWQCRVDISNGQDGWESTNVNCSGR